MIVRDETSATDALAIVEKYEAFVSYLYPILQNSPRRHGVLRDAVLAALFVPIGDLYQARPRALGRQRQPDPQPWPWSCQRAGKTDGRQLRDRVTDATWNPIRARVHNGFPVGQRDDPARHRSGSA